VDLAQGEAMAEQMSSRRPARQPTFASLGVVASQPVRFGLVCAVAYWLFAAVFIFSGHLNPGAFVWLGLIAAAAGIGGWSVALGRRTATPTLVFLGLTVMALPAATREIPRLAHVLDRLGLGAERGSWWRWVDTGDTAATELVTPGVLASLLLAVLSAVVAWYVTRLPARVPRPIHPLLPAAVAASMPIIAAIGPGYDPAVTPFLAGYATLVGMGAAAVTIGAHRRRAWLVGGGWTTVAALPVFHGLGIVTPVREQWAPTLLHDVAGVLATLSAAGATIVGLIRIWRAEHRRPHRAARVGGTSVGLWSVLVIGTAMVVASCAGDGGDGSTTAPPATTATTGTAPTATTSATTTMASMATLDVPPLLVAHAGGIDLWTPEASIPLLTGRSVAAAIPDLRGGVVFQEPQDEFGHAMPILWLSAPGADPEVLIEGDDAFMMTLVQVVEIDAVPVVVYRKWVELPNDCAAEDVECHWAYHQEYLMIRDLAGGPDRILGGIGSFESDVLGFSLGADHAGFSINRYEGGACAGWVPLSELMDNPDGGWIGEGSDLAGACDSGPTPWCPPGERCDGVARAAASPDGTLIAYAFSEWRPETGEHLPPTVVIVDPATDSEMLRVEVGEPGVQPTWLDFDGHFVVLGRVDIRLPGEDQQIEPLLIDTAGATLGVPVTGRATLWSGPEPYSSIPSAAPAHSLPIDGDWTATSLAWPVQPACCDTPAVGPASPSGPIPRDGTLPQDGFYDVIIERHWDPPSVLNVPLRRWVPCSEKPDACPADPPETGVFADPASEVNTFLELTDDVTVVIQPLQTWQDGRFPDPPQVITGSGLAFYELLSGWCSGYLPERNPENCGIDHAFVDWVWSPHQAGDLIDQIIAALESSDTALSFPFTQFDDRATDIPCGTDRRGITAHRGPQGIHLIVDFTLLDMGEDWPARLYGWWTSLEIRNGKPILYIDAGRLAG
jgi:hypothetical protein